MRFEQQPDPNCVSCHGYGVVPAGSSWDEERRQTVAVMTACECTRDGYEPRPTRPTKRPDGLDAIERLTHKR